MQRRKPRWPVHYVATAYRDGAVVACYPDRKPSDRKLKEDGLRIDEDLVFWEIFMEAANSHAGTDFRVRVSDLLANRMSMRDSASWYCPNSRAFRPRLAICRNALSGSKPRLPV